MIITSANVHILMCIKICLESTWDGFVLQREACEVTVTINAGKAERDPLCKSC